MNREVVQSEFQHGMSRLISVCVMLAVGVTAFCFWRVDVGKQAHISVEAPVCAESPDNVQPTYISGATDSWRHAHYINRSERESDLYLVASHNLAEGTELTAADLKVVKMPGLHGYELAFFSPEGVVGMFTAHAVPEGQPVLPYHVSEVGKHGKGTVKIR